MIRYLINDDLLFLHCSGVVLISGFLPQFLLGFLLNGIAVLEPRGVRRHHGRRVLGRRRRRALDPVYRGRRGRFIRRGQSQSRVPIAKSHVDLFFGHDRDILASAHRGSRSGAKNEGQRPRDPRPFPVTEHLRIYTTFHFYHNQPSHAMESSGPAFFSVISGNPLYPTTVMYFIYTYEFRCCKGTKVGLVLYELHLGQICWVPLIRTIWEGDVYSGLRLLWPSRAILSDHKLSD